MSSSEETTRGLASGHRGGFGPAQQTWLLCFNQAEKSKAPQSSVDAPDPLKPGFSSPKPSSSSSKPQTRLSPQHQHPHTSRLDPTCCNPPTLQCPGRSKSSVRGGPKHSFCAEETPALQSAEKRGELPSWLHSAILTLYLDLRHSKPPPSAAEQPRNHGVF